MRQGRTVLEAKRYGVYTCKATTTMIDAARTLLEKDVSALVVVADDETLVGVLSRTDLLRAYVDHEDWANLLVSQYMSTDGVTVTPQTLLFDVAQLLLKNHIHRLVVLRQEGNRQRPVAVVSDGDFVYHMVKQS